MTKLLLISILVAPLIVAARAAGVKNGRVGLKKMLVQIAIFNAFYLFSLLYLYGRI